MICASAIGDGVRSSGKKLWAWCPLPTSADLSRQDSKVFGAPNEGLSEFVTRSPRHVKKEWGLRQSIVEFYSCWVQWTPDLAQEIL